MKKIIATLTIFTLLSCGNKDNDYDASGTFEADEVMVSAEAMGKILELKLEEGDLLQANQKIGMIDGTATELQKEQILASISAIDQKINSPLPQISVLQSQYISQKANISVLQKQLENAVRERNRTANLVKSDAATKKQLDDADGNIDVIQKQINAAQTQLVTLEQQINAAKENVDIQNRAILSEKNPTEKKVAQIDEQLKHNIISSPISGTVLTKYANKGEWATVGKPIFKMADLSYITLRAYISGDQFAKVKLNQPVKILVDSDNGGTRELNGNIYWISDQAEFTPKTIQTKNERANLVYAIKTRVKNDGYLKIGMYGEVRF
ncbi:HlyD family secretion protein [Chryseobacterium koreense]|uniref:HlyD family secretion protein n=1 Tax=Chryseobacterium koreense TaxID=232216 RepID=UPI0026F2A7DB|nr:HlyD family efflux transporter periplasmic adaptor subunit [Chryseobacterium koreense]